MKLQRLALLALMVFPTTLLAADAKLGEEKAAMCMACHGKTGKAVIDAYPNLNGQNQQYLINSMNAYKDGERKGGLAAMMQGIASSLSDEDIENLAAYYSSLK